MRFFILIFFCVNLLFSCFFLDFWTTNSNTTSKVLPAVAFVEQGNFCIDKYEKMTIDKAFVAGHYYSDKAPLPSWLIIPCVSILNTVEVIDLKKEGQNFLPVYITGAFLFGSLPFALILLLMFIAIHRGGTTAGNGISPVLLSTLPFYASFIFVFSGTFFTHIFSGLLLLAGYILIRKKKYLAAGFFVGLSFLCEYTLALFALFWVLQIWVNEKKIKGSIILALGFLPSLIGLFLYNYSITGSALDMIYKYHIFEGMDSNYGFNYPTLESLLGLSFSTYRGVFLYAPFLFLMIYHFLKKISDLNASALLSNYLFLSCIVFFLVIASYAYWDGGWSYGPRFLTAITILLIYEGVISLSKNDVSKQIFWIVIVFGFICALMAKTTFIYSLSTDIKNPFSETLLPAFLNGDFNQNNILSHFFGVQPIYAITIFIVLFIGGVFSLDYWYKKLAGPEPS